DKKLEKVRATGAGRAGMATIEGARGTENPGPGTTRNTTELLCGSFIKDGSSSHPVLPLLKGRRFETGILRTFTKQLVTWMQSYRSILDSPDRERLQVAILDLRDGSLGDVAAVRLLRAFSPEHLSQEAKDWLSEQDKGIKEQLAQLPQRPSD